MIHPSDEVYGCWGGFGDICNPVQWRISWNYLPAATKKNASWLLCVYTRRNTGSPWKKERWTFAAAQFCTFDFEYELLLRSWLFDLLNRFQGRFFQKQGDIPHINVDWVSNEEGITMGWYEERTLSSCTCCKFQLLPSCYTMLFPSRLRFRQTFHLRSTPWTFAKFRYWAYAGFCLGKDIRKCFNKTMTECFTSSNTPLLALGTMFDSKVW